MRSQAVRGAAWERPVLEVGTSAVCPLVALRFSLPEGNGRGDHGRFARLLSKKTCACAWGWF